MDSVSHSAGRNSNIFLKNITVALIVLFTYATLSKLLDYQNFHLQLGKSPLLTGYESIVAWLVPFTEIAIVVLLANKRTNLFGLYASFALLSLFTAYLIVILNYSYYIPCSCGGVLQYLSWQAHIVFNICFLLLTGTAVLIFTNNNEKGGLFSKN